VTLASTDNEFPVDGATK